MSSKQLESILNRVPSATASYSSQSVNKKENSNLDSYQIQKTERIVAVVPQEIKNEIREYLRNHPSETEKIIILKGLKVLGFNVKEEWLVDKRSLR